MSRFGDPKAVLDEAQMEKLMEAAKNLEVSDSLLRDWFAGQALSNIPNLLPEYKNSSVKLSYDYADAMMEERERRKEKKS